VGKKATPAKKGRKAPKGAKQPKLAANAREGSKTAKVLDLGEIGLEKFPASISVVGYV
jgi:hypothetical protein